MARSAADIASQRARPGVVLELLGLEGLPLALVTGVPAGVALVGGDFRLAAALALATLVPVGAFLACRRARAAALEPRKVEALVAVAAAFLLASLLATPAFIVLGLSPVSAFFEAVSGVTTTGLSVARDVTAWPFAAHFLRAWLQWIGGFAFAALAVALIVHPGVLAMRLGAADRPGETLVGSARARARAVLGAYLALSAVAVVAAAICADRPSEGMLIALAAISTGGFAPYPESLGSLGIPLQVVTAVTMLAGAVSMTLFVTLRRQGLRAFAADLELRLLLGILAVGSLAMVAMELARPDGVGVWDTVFTAVSAQTTAGFWTAPQLAHAPAALIVLILMMVIGGSLGSTAGGIKVFRAAFAAAAAHTALVRTALSPNAIYPLHVMGRATEPPEGTTVFGLFFVYLAGVVALWTALVLAGYEPLGALFDTVSAFSTVGLTTGVAGPDLPQGLQLALAVAMLMGRVEFLAFLALVRPKTWI